jgi:hypothetical protein
MLRLLGALPGNGIILINDFIVVVGVRRVGFVLLSVGRLQENVGMLVKPPKVLLVRSWPMHNIAKVVHPKCLPLVPQRNISGVLSAPVHCTLEVPPVILRTEKATN